MKKKSLTRYAGAIITFGLVLTILIPALSAQAVTINTGLNEVQTGAEFGTTELPDLIGNIIKVLLGILGIILVILIVYAGFLWMTASGDSDKVTKAKDIIRMAIIGLIIILAAYSITIFVTDALTNIA